jgi:membrane protein
MLTGRSLVAEGITQRAAALTYHTILSIVPLMAVAFALFKAFGGLQRLEAPLKKAIVENLAMGRAQEVGAWLEHFIENINAGAIAGVGVLILIYSSVGLLTNMEKSMNEIWHTRLRRSFFIRFAVFWCLLTLAPLLMGYSISLTARFQSSAFAASVVDWLPFGLGKTLLSLTSALSACVTFMLIYVVVPSAKVRLRAAFLGGLVASLLWSASKWAFIKFVAGSMKYSAIYGALGILPLLLIWMYISWLIVLFGATYAFAIQTVAKEELHTGRIVLSQRFRELLAVRLVAAVAAPFRRGDPPPTAESLAHDLGTLTPVVRQVLGVLVNHGTLVESGQENEPTYLPGQDLQQTTLASVLEVMREREGHAFEIRDDDVKSKLAKILEEAEAAGRKVLEQNSLYALTSGSGQG